MSEWVVGIDLGASKIAIGLISPDDRIVAYRRIPTRVEKGPQAAVERMVERVADLRDELPHSSRVAAVGICTPGPVDHTTGLLIDPPNLSGWRNVPLKDMLSQRLQVPVRLEHDAKAAALGEYHYGAGRGQRSMVFVVVGTGMGAALIIEGELYRGVHNSAGEMGHTTLNRQGPLCSCGSRGCAETYISGPWLSRYYIAEHTQKAVDSEMALPAEVSGEWIAQRATEGDRLAIRVLSDAGEALGASVATVAMIMDIDFFVIGGSVAKSGDLLLEPARRSVSRYAFGSVASRVRIVGTVLGDDGPILGCGWLARQALTE